VVVVVALRAMSPLRANYIENVANIVNIINIIFDIVFVFGKELMFC
jgi:Na+-driven multidrug efflux pump